MAINYEEYLKKIAELIAKVNSGRTEDIPATIKTKAQKALYNNTDKNETLALELDKAILSVKPDKWRGNQAKEAVIQKAIYEIVKDVEEVKRIFEIVKQQADY